MRDSDWMILNELYRLRNITKAAAALYMTQPTLTKRLQMMEQEFGVTILNRGKYGVEFTEAGEYLALCALQQKEFMDNVNRKLSYLKKRDKGNIIIGTSYSFSRQQLPAILGWFKEQYPEVDYELICVKSNLLVEMMEQEQVDVAFVRGLFPFSGPQCQIGREQAYIISRSELDLERLPAYGRILYDSGSFSKKLVDEWWNDHYQEPPRVIMNASFVDNAFSMVDQGLGYAICFLTSEQVRQTENRLYPLLNREGRPLSRPTCFLYNVKKKRSGFVDEFVKMILRDYKVK